jgi:SNF2 family DNA or RNA helicase
LPKPARSIPSASLFRQSQIANTVKHAIADFPKVLLTATPLQNSLLELFGLVSIIDDFAFGDLKIIPSKGP